MTDPIQIYRCPYVHNYIMFEAEEYFYWLSVDNGIIRAITKNQSDDITVSNDNNNEYEVDE